MSFKNPLTTGEIKEIFAAEIKEAGGNVSDSFDDGTRLYARSILPSVSEVRPKDRAKGGVAIRATEQGIWVHPYVFRVVCSNGAIMAQAIQSRQVEYGEWTSPAQIGRAHV